MSTQGSESQPEHRQLGAVALLLRGVRGDEVLVIDDTAKHAEMAGSLPWRTLGTETSQSWSVPGGGRQEDETVLETLSRELNEELGIAELQHEASLIDAVVGQVAPFLAAQLPEENSSEVNVFAVTGVVLELNKLSSTIRAEIEQLTHEVDGRVRARWASFTELANFYYLLKNGWITEESQQDGFRPHTLVAAHLWLLQTAMGREYSERVAEEFNTDGYSTVLNTIAKSELPLEMNNGAFDSHGQIKAETELLPDEWQYIRPTLERQLEVAI